MKPATTWAGVSRRACLGAAVALSSTGWAKPSAAAAPKGWALWFGAIDAMRRPAHLAAWMGHAQGLVATPLQLEPGPRPALRAVAGGEPLARWQAWAEQAGMNDPTAAAALAQQLDARIADLASAEGHAPYLGAGERLPLAPFLEGAGMAGSEASVTEDDSVLALRRLMVLQPLAAWQTLLRLRSVVLLNAWPAADFPRALHAARRQWLQSVAVATGKPTSPTSL